MAPGVASGRVRIQVNGRCPRATAVHLPDGVLVHTEHGSEVVDPVPGQGRQVGARATIPAVLLEIDVHRVVRPASPQREVEGDRLELVPACVCTGRERHCEVVHPQPLRAPGRETCFREVGHQCVGCDRRCQYRQRGDRCDRRDQPCGPPSPLGGRRPQLPDPSAPAVRCVSLAARAAEFGLSCSHVVSLSCLWLLSRLAPVAPSFAGAAATSAAWPARARRDPCRPAGGVPGAGRRGPRGCDACGWGHEVSRFAPPPRRKSHRDVTPVARSARPPTAPDRPGSRERPPRITCTSAPPSRYPIGRIRRKKAERGREPGRPEDATAWRFTRTQ